MIEYAILIVMVVFAAGFAWLWVIEQRKRQKRKALRQKKIESALAELTVLNEDPFIFGRVERSGRQGRKA
jgi:hypothetical protein